MYEVIMPKLSDSMEEGKIIEWKVEEGDEVHTGDVLAEVESDKAVMELECFHDGVIDEIAFGNDAEVRVGEVIARIREAGEGEEAARAKEAEPEEEPATEEKPKREPRPRAAEPERIAISPYARKLAHQKGVDYSQIEGSGPHGRIVARDIEEAAEEGAPAEKAPTEEVPVPKAKEEPAAAEERHLADVGLPALEVTEDEAEIEPVPFRLKTQARRVTAAKHVIPHFYVTRAVDVTRLMERQHERKEKSGVTLTHLVMLACVKAIGKHPEVNRSYDRGRLIKWKGIRLGLAVDTETGLTVAVIRDAQDLSLDDLVERTGPLVERARNGKLSADERRHATFTITNLGMFGVEQFTPIINPPSSITLAVAAALPSTVVGDGGIHIGRVMKLTAACDHRVVDGATAARFLQDLVPLLEDPDTLLGEAE